MTAREWLEKAKKEKFAIGAFNVGNLETFKAIVQAAANKKSPVIIESSPGETEWMGADNIIDLARNFSREFDIPILANLDHVRSLAECLKGIEAGYTMIHFDGSDLALEENLEIAQKVVTAAHERGVTVEVEMDCIGGSSELHSGSAAEDLSEAPMTDPQKAARFIASTGADILAVFIGNLHGIYTKGDERLDLGTLQKITHETNCFLSLHGGSGIPDDQIKEAIKYGIVKVNINTQLRQTFRNELEHQLKENPDEYALYKILPGVVEKIQQIVENKIEIFGSGGKL